MMALVYLALLLLATSANAQSIGDTPAQAFAKMRALTTVIDSNTHEGVVTGYTAVFPGKGGLADTTYLAFVDSNVALILIERLNVDSAEFANTVKSLEGVFDIFHTDQEEKFTTHLMRAANEDIMHRYFPELTKHIILTTVKGKHPYYEELW